MRRMPKVFLWAVSAPVLRFLQASDATHESAWIQRRFRIELPFHRAHQFDRIAGGSPRIEFWHRIRRMSNHERPAELFDLAAKILKQRRKVSTRSRKIDGSESDRIENRTEANMIRLSQLSEGFVSFRNLRRQHRGFRDRGRDGS